MSLHVVLFLVALAVPAGAPSAAKSKAGCEATLGLWEPTSGWPGRFVGSREGTKYVFVGLRSRPDRKTTEPTTDAEKAAAYATTIAGVWEYSCNGSRMKLNPVFALNPADIGRELAADFEIEGDTMRWWFIGADGKRGELETARRVK